MDDDNFLPLQVNSMAQLRDAIGAFLYHMLGDAGVEDTERSEFPKKLAFSRSTPALFDSFCDFVSSYARFTLDLPSAGTRISVAAAGAPAQGQGAQSSSARNVDESTRRAVLIAIERTLTGSVMSFCSACEEELVEARAAQRAVHLDARQEHADTNVAFRCHA